MAPAGTSVGTEQLAGFFFSAAQRADDQIREGAALFNEGVSTRGIEVDAKTQEALRAIDLTSVAGTIPGGLAAALQRKVLLVYSELSARVAAFNPSSGSTRPAS